MSDSQNNQEPPVPGRKRSLTSITLDWIAQRMRKAEQIKSLIQSGSYQVNSNEVAASILNEEK